MTTALAAKDAAAVLLTTASVVSVTDWVAAMTADANSVHERVPKTTASTVNAEIPAPKIQAAVEIVMSPDGRSRTASAVSEVSTWRMIHASARIESLLPRRTTESAVNV